jgi:hypothetical protein
MRGAFFATVCIALSVSSGASVADEYRPDQYHPDQFLGLDLSKAVLSPKPLGPATEFAPVAVEAKTDHATDHATDRATEAAQARAEPKAGPRMVIPKTRLAHVQSEKPRGAARNRLARRHVNPLDAQAFDARIQVWPCKSGGICSWKRSAE